MKVIAALLLALTLACGTVAARVNVPIPGVGLVTGSGFVVEDAAGRPRLLTAGHVCEAALAGRSVMSLTFETRRGSATAGQYLVKRISEVDDLCELAALVPADHGLRTLTLDTRRLVPHEMLTVTGAPHGFYPVETRGAYVQLIAHDGRPYVVGHGLAAPGNSGSPVTDVYGSVVGMLVMGGGFIYLAVPAHAIAAFLLEAP